MNGGAATMMKGKAAAYVHNGMNVSVTGLNGRRVFTFDLNNCNAPNSIFSQFFMDKIMVEVRAGGKANIVMHDDSNSLYPTGKLKEIAQHLKEAGVTTLGYDLPDAVMTLAMAGIPRGKDVALDVWTARLPESERALAFIDDGK